MDEFVRKFTNLLQYVPYITEDKPNVQIFLNCLLAMLDPYNTSDSPITIVSVALIVIVVSLYYYCYVGFDYFVTP